LGFEDLVGRFRKKDGWLVKSEEEEDDEEGWISAPANGRRGKLYDLRG
jgi:hypothetical protein